MHKAFRREVPQRRSPAAWVGRAALGVAAVAVAGYSLMQVVDQARSIVTDHPLYLEYHGPEGYVRARKPDGEFLAVSDSPRPSYTELGDATTTFRYDSDSEDVPAEPRLVNLALALFAFGRDSLVADLRGERLSQTPVGWSDTEDPRLEKVRGVNLARRDLENARLNGAFLARADLRGVNLSGSDLSQADLRKALIGFMCSSTEGIELDDENLNPALRWTEREEIRGASLAGALLFRSDLRELLAVSANFSEADLTMADLRGSKLADCILSGASLLAADCRGAILDSAVGAGTVLLYGARLEGADLRRLRNLAAADFEFTSYDETTRFPDGLAPPKSHRPLTESERLLLWVSTLSARPQGASSTTSNAAKSTLPGQIPRFAAIRDVVAAFYAQRDPQPGWLN